MRQALSQTLTALATADWRYVAFAVTLYWISVGLGVARWRTALRALGLHLSGRDAFLGLLSGFFINNVTPSGGIGGDAFRIAFVRMRTGTTTKRAIAVGALDKGTDVLCIVGLALLALPTLGYAGHNLQWVGWLVAGILVAVVMAVPSLRRRVVELVQPLRQLNGLQVARALGYGVLIWAQDLLRLTVIGQALGISLTIPQTAAISVVTLLGFLVPTVGGLGAVEGGIVAVLYLFGVPATSAAGFALIERGISYFLATGAGAISLALLGGRRLWARRSAELPS